MKTLLLTLMITAFLSGFGQQSKVVKTNQMAGGMELIIEFEIGDSHNHPSFVIWIEDTLGNYLETLFITQAAGKGVYRFGEGQEGKWVYSSKSYPAAMPYWAHKRGVESGTGGYMPTSKSPMPDAVTAPTPESSFSLYTRTENEFDSPFCVLIEINQTWDWNKYWTNNKFPDNESYKSSSQPAVVYRTTIDPSVSEKGYTFEVIGRSHHSGADGSLFKDIETLTTALEIMQNGRVFLARDAMK